MNGYAVDTASISSEATDIGNTFLESYSRGCVDVGGFYAPDAANGEVPPELLCGDFRPPAPPDDVQRVRELYQFRVLKELNHDVKLGLNKFARLASLVCGTKIALVNFLDDKHQYSSAESAPAQWLGHTAIPRGLSVCAHAILRRSNDIFEIPDMAQDWRFREKPYVAGHPKIRYYAGIPLRTKSGYNIGSLCVLDYVPHKLNETQVSALHDLANMVMNDLELHRDKELVGLKGRMANSITQFTRGLANHEHNSDEREKHREALKLPRTLGGRKSGRNGWIRKDRVSKDVNGAEDDGVMHYGELMVAQEAVNGVEEEHSSGETDGDTTDTESVSSSQVGDAVDLKAMYRYACRLMRETLDVEGVCFVDIDGINWESAAAARDSLSESDGTNGSSSSARARREFGAASSILGYSHNEQFRQSQLKNWNPIARWDEEADSSNPLNFQGKVRKGSRISLQDDTTFLDPEFPVHTGHFDDGSYVSAHTGSHFEGGGFSNQYLATFISENPYGKIFNEGLPAEIRDFLPPGVTSAILVPIYDFDHHPFAMTCAYSTNKHKWFIEPEKKYLESFGAQILSQVLKKRIIMADRAKGIFISNISHELRSPLHGILASAEFLSDTRLDTLQRTFIDTIDSCGRTLLEVINHVLDFGKLTYIARLKNKVSRPHIQRSTSKETVPQTLNTAPVDLMAIAEQVVESCYAGHEFRGIFGQVDIGTMLSETGQKLGRGGIEGYGRAKDPKSALTVVIDIVYREEGWHFLLQSGAVQRILMNIVGNALKYTPAGWVRVHVSFEEKDRKTTVHIIVSDSGKGISPEFLKNRLFSPFAQEDTLQVGTGLGMSIVKQVVERLGGSINVNSQVNVGTQVHISLPAESVPRPAGVDSCVRLRNLTKGMKVFLAGFDNRVPASRLLYESIANYLTHWYDIRVVEDVNSSDLIISDECPELLDYFQQTSPSDRSPFAFSQSSVHSGTPFPTPDSAGSHSVYRAWQPLIVLCSNALRYEFFGQQAEEGKIMDFSSKPIGPYKLARSILFCIEQAETRRRSLEVSSPPIKPVEEGVFEEHVGVPGGRQGSMGRGVVRFSPTVRRGSADHSASMYLPGKGLVPAPTSSIVEPQKFVGMRRKTHAKVSLSGSSIPPEDERESEIQHTISQTEQPQGLIPAELPPTPSPETVTPPTRKTAAFAKPEVYNRQNPPRSVALTQPSQKAEFTDINIPPTPAVLDTLPSRKPCVLIVEDNAVNALILATFLRKRNFPFVKAENGLLAVQAVQSRPEGFDVILMDIQMPVMDGSAATAAIRAIERDRGTAPTSYIIALTGLAADKDRQVAFDSGVDHFLTKPVSLKQLGVVIDDWKTRDVVRGGLKSDFLQHKITVV